jgi:hypothetical protein
VSELVELVTAFPAVVFTALLAFCLAWWLVATVAGIGDGVDSDADADGAFDDLGDALGISSVPPAIGLSIIAFVGWVVSLAVTAGVRAADVGGAALVAAGAVALAASLAAGVLVARPVARRVAPLFVTELAPSEREAIGAFARVRSPEVDDDDAGAPGEVVVTSGTLRGATFRARAVPGRRYARGAAVHIVSVDGVDGRPVVTVDDMPAELAP